MVCHDNGKFISCSPGLYTTPKEEPFKRKKIREDFIFAIFLIVAFIPFCILYMLVVIHTEIEERYKKWKGIEEKPICFHFPEDVIPDQE